MVSEKVNIFHHKDVVFYFFKSLPIDKICAEAHVSWARRLPS